MRSVEFLDAIKKAYGLNSDYKLAKLMGWAHTRISNYRKGRSRFDEDTCHQIAEKLHLDPVHVMASVAAERTTSKAARNTWQRLAEATRNHAAKLAGPVAVAAFLSASTINGLSPSYTGANNTALYIMVINT